MTAYPIPKAALDDRLAFVGTSGSGKTYAAGTAVERLLKSGAKVVVVDPLDVWYGLRVHVDGKRPAFPVVIFGGAHGDIPLTEYTGGLIGETVAGMSESCIVSLGGFSTKSAERRFMLAFLERLYRRAGGEPFHIVFDEADLWAPQKSSEPQLQNLMEQIVRRGRVKGFIPWLITQRPAVLSKDVLSQADGLVAMKLTSSQDRDALGAWIEGQADRADEKRMLAALPPMQRGHGIIWIPGRGVLTEAAFPAKTTFDSSRTPKRGELQRTATLKPIDLGKLKERIASIETAQAKPKAKPAPATSSPAATSIDIKAIRAEGFVAGQADGYRQAQKDAQAAIAALGKPVVVMAAVQPIAIKLPPSHAPATKADRRPDAAPDMPAGEKAVLITCAQHSNGVTRQQITVTTGYKRATRNTYILRLKNRGLVEEVGERILASAAGIAALGADFKPLPTGAELREVVLATLPEGESKVLEVLLGRHPNTVDRETISEITGYKRATRNKYILRLRQRELVEVSSDGARASDHLFE